MAYFVYFSYMFFIYLVFSPRSQEFFTCETAARYGESSPQCGTSMLTTIRKLMTDLPSSGRRGIHRELDSNSQRSYWQLLVTHLALEQ